MFFTTNKRIIKRALHITTKRFNYMKRLFLLSVIILIANISFAQFNNNTMLNDTLRPFGKGAYALDGICQDDSFYYMLGGVNNYQPKWNLMVLKMDKNGVVVNKKKFNDSLLYYAAYPYNSMVKQNSKILFCTTIRDTSNFVNGMIMCLNKHTLDTIWTKIYPHPDTANIITLADNYSVLTAIKSTPDNNYILAGNYMRAGSARSYLMKIDSLGNVIWTKAYDDVTYLYDIENDIDGGFLFINPLGNNVNKLAKTDSLGVIIWQIQINSGMSGLGTPTGIKKSTNNTVVCGRTYTYDYVNDLIGVNIFKVDVISKQILWDKTYILYKSFGCITLHQAMGVETMPNGSIIVSGTLTKYGGDRLGFILKLNSNGDSLWTKTYHFGSPIYDDSQLNDILLCDDGGFMGVGFFSSEWASVNDAAWIFKTDSNGVVGWELPKAKGNSKKIKVWPNPASEIVNIEIKERLKRDGDIIIYNSLGMKVKKVSIISGKTNYKIQVDDLETGVYFYEIIGDEKIIGSGKFIKL